MVLPNLDTVFGPFEENIMMQLNSMKLKHQILQNA